MRAAGWRLGLGGGRGGLRFRFRRAGAALDEVDVAAGGGAGEEDAFEGRGAQEASVQVGEDGGEVGGAEAGGDGVEVGGGGALADGVDQVAAVGEQDADGVEQDLDVVGQSGGGVILCGIGRGGDGCCGRDGLHGSISNIKLEQMPGVFPQEGLCDRKENGTAKHAKCGSASQGHTLRAMDLVDRLGHLQFGPFPIRRHQQRGSRREPLQH